MKTGVVSAHRGGQIALALTLTMCSSLWAVAGSLPGPVAETLARHGIPGDDVSLYVQGVAEPGPRVEVNAEEPRNPASVIKLLTSYAALDILGPSYTWRTEALLGGPLRDGRLDGDLVIKGYGDPYLTPQSLWHFLRGLRDRGLETVAGDVVLDGSHFAAPTAARGDFDGRPHKAYNALPAALAVNFQVTRVHMYPDDATGAVRVFTDPPVTGLRVDNRIRLVDAPCRNRDHRPRLVVAAGDAEATIQVAGTFSAECGEASYPRLVLGPEAHLAGVLERLWAELGGRIEGSVRTGLRSETARHLHSLESRPLVEVIHGVNKWSNNLISRSLFMTLGAERFGEPGTPEKGAGAVREWLLARDLRFPELVLDNGSGLSRDARISAKSLGRLLVHAYSSPVMPELMASMAVAGRDGTMKKRLHGEPVEGRAHLKTGSLNHVSTMAGYVLDQDGRRWVVALLINHKGVLAWEGKQVQDALIRWVYEGGPSARPATRLAGQSEADDERAAGSADAIPSG